MDNNAYDHEMQEKPGGHTDGERYNPRDSEPQTASNRCSTCCKDNLIMVLTFLAVVLGFAIGFGLREVELSADAKTWIGMPGYIFLNLLKMCIVPLIVSSVISAVATLDPEENGRVGGIQLAYLVITNIMGATIGTILAVLIKPGSRGSGEGITELASDLRTSDIFADLIRNVFPDNVVRATMQKVQTYYEDPTFVNESVDGTFILREVRGATYLDHTGGTNVLGLIFLSFLFGLATAKAGPKGKPFLDFFQSAIDIIIILLQWLMWVVPIGILSLVVLAIAKIGDLKETFSQIGFFALAVIVGIALHQLLFVPLIYIVATRKNPIWLYIYGFKAWLVSFASTSMAVGMPYIYQMQERPRLQWDRRVSNFAIPMAVALSKDGSAIFIAVSCFFLAQLEGLSISVGNSFLIWILVGTASLAIPAVPSASIVSIIIVAGAVGIPTEHIGLLFTVEWLLDRLRTSSNLISNLMSISFTNHFFLKYQKKHGKDYYGEDYDLKM